MAPMGYGVSLGGTIPGLLGGGESLPAHTELAADVGEAKAGGVGRKALTILLGGKWTDWLAALSLSLSLS